MAPGGSKIGGGRYMVLFTRSLIVFYLLWAGLAWGQSRVDLGTQSKSVDLSNLGPTKPIQKGTTVPATCSVGQLFFKTDAVPGANLYGCVATDTWMVLAAGGAGLTNSGVSVSGNLPVYLDGSGTQLVDSGISGSPAVLMTQPLYQAGTPLNCIGQVGDTGSVMSCGLSPTLTGYVARMLLRFTPGTANSGAVTLNINTLGPLAVKASDCSTDPAAGYFQAGQTYLLTFNGTSFCEIHGGSTSFKPAAPYLQLGTDYYLPYAFKAALPPTSGWTGVNFTGAAFSTTGMGGVIQIQSGSTRSGEALNLQYVPRSGTSTLIAAVSSAGLSTATPFGACGVGAYNSSTTGEYVLMQQLQAAAAPLLEAGYSSPTVQTFAGNAVLSNIGGVLYLRIDIAGSTVTSSYSTTGAAGSWIQVNSRTLGSSGMPTSVDSWSLFGEPAGASPVTCRLLSWNTF
jgi:hypothetical protein